MPSPARQRNDRSVSRLNGTIFLNTLAKLAQVLDCEVHYILSSEHQPDRTGASRERAGAEIDLTGLSRTTELAVEPEVLASLSTYYRKSTSGDFTRHAEQCKP